MIQLNNTAYNKSIGASGAGHSCPCWCFLSVSRCCVFSCPCWCFMSVSRCCVFSCPCWCFMSVSPLLCLLTNNRSAGIKYDGNKQNTTLRVRCPHLTFQEHCNYYQ